MCWPLSSSFGHADKSLRSEKQKGGTKGIRVKPGRDLAGLFNVWTDRTLLSCQRVGDPSS
jgi:hypothetical protein